MFWRSLVIVPLLLTFAILCAVGLYVLLRNKQDEDPSLPETWRLLWKEPVIRERK